jgi:hypothetical protein
MAAIDAPVGGTVKVVSSEYKIASIDLQLVRKEEVMMAGKTASDISEVQVRRTCRADCRLTHLPKIGAWIRTYTTQRPTRAQTDARRLHAGRYQLKRPPLAHKGMLANRCLQALTETFCGGRLQSIQLADGDICHGMEVPIHMILPRLYTCPSITTGSFSINFELNLVVAFQTGANPSDKNALMAAYKFPIKVVRLAPR